MLRHLKTALKNLLGEEKLLKATRKGAVVLIFPTYNVIFFYSSFIVTSKDHEVTS